MSDKEAQVIRRQDLLDLGESFKEALSPIADLVKHVQEQNVTSNELLLSMAKHDEGIKRVNRWLLLLAFGALVAISIHIVSVLNLYRMVLRMETTAEELNKLARKVDDGNKVTKNVKSAVEEQTKGPCVAVVAEDDPEEAKEAPLKVRITSGEEQVAGRPSPLIRAESLSGDEEGLSQLPGTLPKTTIEIPIPSDSVSEKK